VGTISDDAPFNFNLERFDSMMIDSDDFNTSQRKKEKPGLPDQRSRPLSKFILLQQFDNFKEVECASKNILANGGSIPKDQIPKQFNKMD
jgi:hypothetical protein